MADHKFFVFLTDFPPDRTAFPPEWALTVPSPPEPATLGPFTPVAGSSAIYTFLHKPETGAISARIYTLCSHLLIAEPIPHPDDLEGFDTVAMLANSGQEVWGCCEWTAHPHVPGAVLGTFTNMVGFGFHHQDPQQNPEFDIFGLPNPPHTESLLRPTPNYASLAAFAPLANVQTPRNYPWTRSTTESSSGAVSYMFYDRMDDENAPLTRPFAGMHVIFRKEQPAVHERATPIIITEVTEEGIEVERKFRGWIGRAEVDVLFDRVETNGFAGTIIEAHPGVLPNGRPCVSGLVTFRTMR